MSAHDPPYVFLEADGENGLRVLLISDDGGEHLRPASGPEVAMYRLLEQLRRWDVLNPSAPDGSDAPYWQREIAKVIGEKA